MLPIISRAIKLETDDLPRTDWFGPDQYPTIAGEYEARTGGGHVFERKWTGEHWLNAITGLKSTAPCDWRGIRPGSIEIGLYPAMLRTELAVGLQLLDRQANRPNLAAQHEAIGLPFA